MIKDGDRIVALANLIALEEMAKKREYLAKMFRLAIWKQGKVITGTLERQDHD